jgi:hypothetical protein
MKNDKAQFMVISASHTSCFSGDNSIVIEIKEVELFDMNFPIHHFGL